MKSLIDEIKGSGSVCILSALLMFIISGPFFVWGIIETKVMYFSVIGLFYVLCFFHSNFMTKNDILYFILFISVISLMCYLNNNNLFGLLSTVPLSFIPFLKKKFLKGTYKFFFNIVSIVLFFSVFFWIMYLLGFHLPGRTIEPINTLKNYNYTAYPFLLVSNSISSALRFHAVFDEPGFIGTYAIILLCIEQFNLKKWQNIILLLSGLLSLSLFFYLMCLLYLIIFVISKGKKLFFRLIIILVAVCGIFAVNNKNNTVLYEAIGQRMQFDTQENKFVGDNRAHDDLLSYYRSIKGTKQFWLGVARDNPNLIRDYSGSAGYRNAILNYGLLGCLLYLLFFFVFARHSMGNTLQFLVFYLFFVLTLYQRPGVFNIVFVFLFSSWISFFSSIRK